MKTEINETIIIRRVRIIKGEENIVKSRINKITDFSTTPMLHQVASTCSSCVEQPVQRLFFALAAANDMKVYGGDAQDALAHSPPPATPTCIIIDDAYADWYKARYGVDVDRHLVLPVQHALQGHPESGRLWEERIKQILSLPELAFQRSIAAPLRTKRFCSCVRTMILP
jgi:hypothetical protein